MSLEHFSVSKTPESRTPYVLLLLAAIGLIGSLWRAWIGSPYAVEIFLAAAALAIGYAVSRYVRQPRG